MCLTLRNELGKLATKAQGPSAALIALPITREAMRRLVACCPVLMGLLSAIVQGDTRSNLKIALPGSRATHWNLHFFDGFCAQTQGICQYLAVFCGH